MAYSMMSTTNHKRRCIMSSSKFEANNTSFEASDDRIKLDLEDFINDEDYDDNEDNSSIFSCFGTSSNYSGAASDFLLQENRENFMSKKRKTMEAAFVDHELEDTASSPVQSPKVNHLNLFYMKSKDEIESRDICQMQENGHNNSRQAGDSMNTGSLESELRKKGLCLIPTSTLLNYLSAN
ncbi:uncharacterized protein LOC110689926 [Chenopodium quinoa]|uniref:Uncharacterized protein n=1 Tax=Chenopodium quinoa TaxID=63459 RepID=A0A803M988_CHEQI|nr:uncharacterized protein LOC110689926 [Chenopodium quinoa]